MKAQIILLEEENSEMLQKLSELDSLKQEFDDLNLNRKTLEDQNESLLSTVNYYEQNMIPTIKESMFNLEKQMN